MSYEQIIEILREELPPKRVDVVAKAIVAIAPGFDTDAYITAVQSAVAKVIREVPLGAAAATPQPIKRGRPRKASKPAPQRTADVADDDDGDEAEAPASASPLSAAFARRDVSDTTKVKMKLFQRRRRALKKLAEDPNDAEAKAKLKSAEAELKALKKNGKAAASAGAALPI